MDNNNSKFSAEKYAICMLRDRVSFIYRGISNDIGGDSYESITAEAKEFIKKGLVKELTLGIKEQELELYVNGLMNSVYLSDSWIKFEKEVLVELEKIQI